MTNSIYDKITASGTSATDFKQRMVETFSGDALDTNRWEQKNYSGTGTFAMVDGADGGFSITTASDTNARNSGIEFNNIRPFSHTGSVWITVFRTVTASNNQVVVGLVDNAYSGGGYYQVRNRQGNTYYQLQTRSDAAGSTSTDTTTNTDTSWHVHKGQVDGINATLHIDGVQAVTTTSTVPNDRMEPVFDVLNHTSAQANEARIRYLEVYNT